MPRLVGSTLVLSSVIGINCNHNQKQDLIQKTSHLSEGGHEQARRCAFHVILAVAVAVGRTQACTMHKRFDRQKSTTAEDIEADGSLSRKGALRDQITVTFGTGEISGVFIQDLRGETLV